MSNLTIDYQSFADKVFTTFCKLSMHNYKTMIVDQNQDKVQVFDMTLTRNGFAIFPKTGEYALFTSDEGWSDRKPIFNDLETMRAGHIGIDWDQQIEMLKIWVSKTAS